MEQVDTQCFEIDEENAALEEQIMQALRYQTQLNNQGRDISNQISEAKSIAQRMQDEKLELNRQIRISNQEAIFFQGQAELLKNSLRRDIQLLKDREQKQKVISQREQEVFLKNHNLNCDKIAKLTQKLQAKEREIEKMQKAIMKINQKDELKLNEVSNIPLPDQDGILSSSYLAANASLSTNNASK